MLLVPLSAEPAGLGRLHLLSSFGQPFHAEIDLISETEPDAPSLTARLASPETYSNFDLQYGIAHAGLLVSIEKRPSGQSYIKITSVRLVRELFVSLLIELDWPTGRLVRNFTALLDPPPLDMPPPRQAAVRATGPEARPAPVAPAPALAQPGAADAPAPIERGETVGKIAREQQPEAARPAPVAPVPAPDRPAAAREYGPVQRGETMGKIATQLQPEGVSLVQTIMGFFHGNPGAFIRKNVNLLMAGATLQVPAKEQVAATPHSEAVKEFRAHLAAWVAYRDRLAGAAGAGAKKAEEARDVTRISRGEPPRAAGGSVAAGNLEERARVLEEESIASGKTLAEAKDRIAQLEKTIKDMELLVEARRQATPEQGAAKPAATPESVRAEATTVQPKAASPTDRAAVAPATEAEKPEAASPTGRAVVAQATQAEKPKARTEVLAPSPQPEPELIDRVMDNLPIVGGGAAALLIGVLLLARRRRLRVAAGDESVLPGAGMHQAAARGRAAPAAADGEHVDAIEEASIFMAHGREAQAAQVLEDALAKDRSRADVWLKLLEIDTARKDRGAFAKHARALHEVTGGQGEIWRKAAAMGFALDPGNALYAAGAVESGIPAVPGAYDIDSQSGTATPAADYETSRDDAGVGPTVSQDAGPQSWKGSTLDIEMTEPPEGALMTDISFDVPDAAAPATDWVLGAEEPKQTSADDAHSIEFSVELPKVDEPAEDRAPAAQAEGEDQAQDQDANSAREFGLDLDSINLELDDEPKAGPARGADDEDPHWRDVQAKFELVKAYKILGAEKTSVLDILQDIVKEGDAQQRAEATKLIDEISGNEE